MEFLQSLADNAQLPVLSAFILGLMTAISPCPLATNISAIGFISKDLQHKRRIFLNGILYTLGRAFSYTVLGIVLIMILKQGASIYKIQKVIATYGEMLIGPLMVIIGIFMLDFIRLNFSAMGKLSSTMENHSKSGSFWSSFLLGVVFALAFCPYSGIFYFGVLIPMSVTATSGYFLPLVFALATGLPVVIFAWVLAYSVSSVGTFYNRIKIFEKWFRKIVAIVFILVGLYYCWIAFIK